MIDTLRCFWADVTGVTATRNRQHLEDRLAAALTNLRAATLATEEQRKRKEQAIRMYGGLVQKKTDELNAALNALNEVLAENVKLQRHAAELEREVVELREVAQRAELTREAMLAYRREMKINAVKDAVRRSPKVIPLNASKTEVKK